jgi:hypothetical protein
MTLKDIAVKVLKWAVPLGLFLAFGIWTWVTFAKIATGSIT